MLYLTPMKNINAIQYPGSLVGKFLYVALENKPSFMKNITIGLLSKDSPEIQNRLQPNDRLEVLSENKPEKNPAMGSVRVKNDRGVEGTIATRLLTVNVSG